MSGIRQRKNVADSASGLPSHDKPKDDDEIQPDAGWGVFFKICIFVFVVLPSICVLAGVLLIDSPIEPVKVFDGLSEPPKLEGVLAQNDLLVYQGQRLFQGKVRGPESLVYQNGHLYTGTADGKILHIELSTGHIDTVTTLGTPPCGSFGDEHHCGRPLGMRFDQDGYMIVVDAYLGMYRINVASRDVVQLFPSTIEVEGRALNFLNDLDIAKDGTIYFTDSSRFNRREFPLDLLEGRAHGRLLKHDPVENRTELLLDGLYFANGVQLSRDGSYVLVAETPRCRIKKYHLTGPKQGQAEIFAENLPGTVDNIRRSSNGGYWAVLGLCRHADRFNLMDSLSAHPWIRKQLAKLPLEIFSLFMPKCGMIVELNKDGEIVRSLQDLHGERLQFMSEVEDHAGILYIGSFVSPYIGKVDTYKKA